MSMRTPFIYMFISFQVMNRHVILHIKYSLTLPHKNFEVGPLSDDCLTELAIICLFGKVQ
jgi:hypothetical protein